jgi:DNA-directed RNA polymerase III subunit RPC6
MVYTQIDEAGADGIWSRTLKARLKMHESVMKQCIKELERRGYITDMKSVEHPNKKMYIKANLKPSDRATGGPWYTDNDLDEAFIAQLEVVIFRLVMRDSASCSTHGGGTKKPTKGVLKGGEQMERGKKRGPGEMSDDTGAAASHQMSPTAARHHRKEVLLPLPAGYIGYPTVKEIATKIAHSGLTMNTTLTEADIQQLVDVLVFDGLIEPIKVGRRRGYKVMRIAKQDPKPMIKQKQREHALGEDEEPMEQKLEAKRGMNGLMEAPCGRCPVFELCEEGGPVSPSNCVYFQQWLGLDC